MPGRARLRFDLLRDEHKALLPQIGTTLAEQANVNAVRAVPQTSSLLIEHTGELGPILEQAQAHGLFELQAAPKHNPMRRLQRAFELADARLSEQTHDALNLSNLTFAVLVAAGVWRAGHGRLLPAGATLFSYALNVMERAARREPPLDD
jgi:hypothetical protein